jgi:hypothetical protein
MIRIKQKRYSVRQLSANALKQALGLHLSVAEQALEDRKPGL